MNHQSRNTEVTLDDLLALVEKAAGAIDRLQAANVALTAELREQTAAAQAAANALEQASMRIEELERTAEALRRDAHWHRWFRGKYSGNNFSTFFAHIENEYQADHPEDTAPRSDETRAD